MPAERGNGLAMRAGVFLEALAAECEVFLLVVPVGGPLPADGLPDLVTRAATRTVILDLAGRQDTHLELIARVADPVAREAALHAYPRPLLTGIATPPTVREAAGRFADIRLDAVHVMRLHLAPFAEPWLGRAGGQQRLPCVLDLDDDEVRTRERLAALHEARGEPLAARREAREAERYARFEREYLPRFDRLLVCAPGDAAALQHRLALTTVDVVPNAVRIPDAARSARDPGAGRLLFVGSLGYLPNADAAHVLCHEILPQLRARAVRPVEVEIVGAHAAGGTPHLAGLPGVRVTTDVPSVTPHYARSDVAVAPIRAGGGTRIKLLEAFAHRVPVVATGLGAEGLDVEAGVHLLIADDAPAFATACSRLLDDARLGRALSAHAWERVTTRYAVPVVAAHIRHLYRTLLGFARPASP